MSGPCVLLGPAHDYADAAGGRAGGAASAGRRARSRGASGRRAGAAHRMATCTSLPRRRERLSHWKSPPGKPPPPPPKNARKISSASAAEPWAAARARQRGAIRARRRSRRGGRYAGASPPARLAEAAKAAKAARARVAAAHGGRLLERGGAHLVVLLPLLRVAQHLVRLIYVLEL